MATTPSLLKTSNARAYSSHVFSRIGTKFYGQTIVYGLDDRSSYLIDRVLSPTGNDADSAGCVCGRPLSEFARNLYIHSGPEFLLDYNVQLVVFKDLANNTNIYSFYFLDRLFVVSRKLYNSYDPFSEKKSLTIKKRCGKCSSTQIFDHISGESLGRWLPSFFSVKNNLKPYKKKKISEAEMNVIVSYLQNVSANRRVNLEYQYGLYAVAKHALENGFGSEEEVSRLSNIIWSYIQDLTEVDFDIGDIIDSRLRTVREIEKSREDFTLRVVDYCLLGSNRYLSCQNRDLIPKIRQEDFNHRNSTILKVQRDLSARETTILDLSLEELSFLKPYFPETHNFTFPAYFTHSLNSDENHQHALSEVVEDIELDEEDEDEIAVLSLNDDEVEEINHYIEEIDEAAELERALEEIAQQMALALEENARQEAESSNAAMDRARSRKEKQKANKKKGKMVGGESDCWKIVTATHDDTDYDYMITAQALVDLIESGISHDRPEPPELCAACFCDPPIEGSDLCQDCTDAGEESSFDPRSRWERAQDDYSLGIEFRPDGNLHLIAYKYENGGRISGKHSKTGDWNADFPSHAKWFTLREFTALANDGVEDSESADDIMVGSSVSTAMAAIEESQRVNAAEFAKNDALLRHNNDIESIPKVDIRLTSLEEKKMAKYLEHPIMSTQRSNYTGDHKALAVARILIRRELDKLFPHNQDGFSILHVGSTAHELKTWWSHAGRDFLFHLQEDKDIVRTYEDLSKMVTTMLNGMKLPSLSAKSLHRGVKVRLKTMDEAFRLLEKGGRQRIFKTVPERYYDGLFFEDCLYGMPINDFINYFNVTQSKFAYATLFIPDQMINPNAMESDFYELEYHYDIVEKVEEFIDQIWPELLAVTPLIPADMVNEVFRKTIRKCLTEGWSLFKSWVSSIKDNPFPIELFVGNVLDMAKLQPIVLSLFGRFKKVFDKHLRKARIRWRGGYSNSYDHRTLYWEAYAKQRRFQISSDWYLDSEIVSREGEMYLIKYWISAGNDPIVNDLQLPVSKQTILLADLQSVWNPVTKSLDYDRLEYFPINAKDYQTILNWGTGEPEGTLTVGMMITMINRVMGGLSLANNTLVEPMSFASNQVQKIAIVILMEVYRLTDVLSQIENSKELKDIYKTNFRTISETVAKYGIILATGGLAIPAYLLFKWLMENTQTIEFVKYPENSNFKRIEGKSKKTVRTTDVQFNLNIQPKSSRAKLSCFICELQRLGKFSVSGDPEEGQEFFCSSHEYDGNHTIGFDNAECVKLIDKIRLAQSAHESMGAGNVIDEIKKMKKFYETNQAGIKSKVNIQVITGGPGTGKSEIFKSIAATATNEGKVVSIVSPFRELLSDYTDCKVIGQKNKMTFNANTVWYASKVENVDYLMVDEMTGVDWDVIKAIAIYCGARCIILAGDPLQTCLNYESGEGADPTNKASGFPWNEVPKHELCVNFRMDKWRVLAYNKVFGYKMRTSRTDMLPPIFITAEQYRAMPKVDREIVFSHAAADVFGKTSGTGPSEVNMSVRSNQGKTYRTVAVSCSQLDDNTMKAHGMINVALSRAKGQTYIVCPESIDDPTPVSLKNTMFLTPDGINLISQMAWPPRPDPSPQLVLSPEEDAVEKMLKHWIKHEPNKIRVDGPEGEKDTVLTQNVLDIEPATINLSFESPVDSLPYLPFLTGIFNTCLFDAVRKHMKEEDETEMIWHDWMQKVLLAMYDDDTLMGRPNQSYSLLERLMAVPNYDARHRLPIITIDGKTKRNIPLSLFLRAFEATKRKIVVYSGKQVIYRSKDLEKWPRRDIYFIDTSKEHAVEKIPPPTLVKWSNVKEVVFVDSWAINAGKFIIDHKPDPKLKYVLIDVMGSEYSPENSTSSDSDSDSDPDSLFTDDTESSSSSGGDSDSSSILTSTTLSLDSENPNNPPAPVVAVRRVRSRFPISPLFSRSINLSSPSALFDFTPGILVWNKEPTFRQVRLPEMDHDERAFYTHNMDLHSSWVIDRPQYLEKAPKMSKFRYGTDGYRLADFIDPSKAWTRSSALNEFSGVRGCTNRRTNLTVMPDGFVFSRTKAGRLKRTPLREYRSANVGMANHFNNSKEETLIAAQRVSVIGNAPKMTAESKRWAQDVAKRYFHENWYPSSAYSSEEHNLALERAIRLCKERNYYKRALALQKKSFGRPTLIISNKDIEKPLKNDKLDLLKKGQAILQQTPRELGLHLAQIHEQSRLAKAGLREHFHTDFFENVDEFCKGVSRHIKQLPAGIRMVVGDAEEWDSQQGEVTTEIEKAFARLTGVDENLVEEYYKYLGPTKGVMFGAFKFKKDWQVGSGFANTIYANSNRSAALYEYVTTGTGPKCVISKGDDYFKAQVGAGIDKLNMKKVKTYTGLKLDINIGEGQEVIGHSISRAGMYKSITRTAMKTVCKRAGDYKKFAEQQIALRDTVQTWLKSGIEETIHYSSFAERKDPNYTMACLAYVNSMAHINEKQWLESTRLRANNRYYLNSDTGPVLI